VSLPFGAWRGMDHYCRLQSWLFEVGAAEDIRSPNDVGRTPMFAACQEALWLLAVGVAEDIRTRGIDRVAECLFECLFEEGAAEDIRTQCSLGRTSRLATCAHDAQHVISGSLKWALRTTCAPMSTTARLCMWGHLEVVTWLISKAPQTANKSYNHSTEMLIHLNTDLSCAFQSSSSSTSTPPLLSCSQQQRASPPRVMNKAPPVQRSKRLRVAPWRFCTATRAACSGSLRAIPEWDAGQRAAERAEVALLVVIGSVD